MSQKRVFYCVSMAIYDGCKADVHITSVATTIKPKSTFKSTYRADFYTDYFDTLEEAKQFARE